MRPGPRLLVADADDAFAAALCARLARERFAVESVPTARAARERLEAQAFALAVVDLGLPGLDVGSLVRAPRGLITLCRDVDPFERVISLELGADDSLAKPVHVQELVARIRSILRSRANASAPRSAAGTTRFDGWELKRLPRRLTSPAGAPVSLTEGEFALLSAFLERPREVVSRFELSTRVRGAEHGATGRSIDLRVSRLRRKLDSADGGDRGPIRTVRGAGYLFDIRSLEGC